MTSNAAILTHPLTVNRFYFPSQVTKEGKAVDFPELNGEAHGTVYWNLVKASEQGAWDVRFLGDGKVVPATS